jgi:hypothetical protein
LSIELWTSWALILSFPSLEDKTLK